MERFPFHLKHTLKQTINSNSYFEITMLNKDFQKEACRQHMPHFVNPYPEKKGFKVESNFRKLNLLKQSSKMEKINQVNKCQLVRNQMTKFIKLSYTIE